MERLKIDEVNEMKYLSIAIPCYNSEDYMDRAIQSLLPGGEDVEIIIVNDGSTDHTLEIARRYEKEYPTHCKSGGQRKRRPRGCSE